MNSAEVYLIRLESRFSSLSVNGQSTCYGSCAEMPLELRRRGMEGGDFEQHKGVSRIAGSDLAYLCVPVRSFRFPQQLARALSGDALLPCMQGMGLERTLLSISTVLNER